MSDWDGAPARRAGLAMGSFAGRVIGPVFWVAVVYLLGRLSGHRAPVWLLVLVGLLALLLQEAGRSARKAGRPGFADAFRQSRRNGGDGSP